MIKMSMLLRRRQDLSIVEFADAWRLAHEISPAQIAGEAPGLTRRVYNRPVGHGMPIANAPAAPFDAIDEVWFDSRAAAQAYLASDLQLNRIRPSEIDLLDRGACPTVIGEVRVMWHRPAETKADAVKLIILPVRREGMSHPEFRDYWMHHHSPLAMAGPNARDRVQHIEFTPADPLLDAGYPTAPFEGSGAIWFDSVEDLDVEFSSDYYREVLQPDEVKFTDPARSHGMMVSEVVLWNNA